MFDLFFGMNPVAADRFTVIGQMELAKMDNETSEN